MAKKTIQDRVTLAQKTGQWPVVCVAHVLMVATGTIRKRIREGMILASINTNAAGTPTRGIHIKREHFRDYVRRMYGRECQLLKEI